VLDKAEYSSFIVHVKLCNRICYYMYIICISGASASGPVFAQRLHQSMVVSGSASASPATSIPRNPSQVKNTLINQRNKTRHTRDALYNLHELAYDFDFIQHITIHTLTFLS